MKPSALSSFGGLALFVTLVCAGTVLAGPSLPITKPPVPDITILTGPTRDPAATNGQWFLGAGGIETARTHEFYDDMTGGSGPGAIFGVVSNITYDSASNITAFSIAATIINDTSGEHQAMSGNNSHGEQLGPTPKFEGTLFGAKLAAEFAGTDTTNLPAQWVAPYRDRSPYIVADNEAQSAWYCWTPENPQQQQPGKYYAPTWDFGDIPPGGSATRQLDFSIPAGLPTADPRYAVIQQSFFNLTDILANRTTSLKISAWIDELDFDPFYGGEPLRGSDVSVFHGIEESQEEYLDFGDAPAPYPTLLADNGARHRMPSGYRLGPVPTDADPDGRPSADADGDDLDNLADEDGVIPRGNFVVGQVTLLQITASTNGWLDGWIDFNRDGDWLDLGENVASAQPLNQGTNIVPVAVPSAALPGVTYSRARFSGSAAGLAPTGLADDGEVEDYNLMVYQQGPSTNIVITNLASGALGEKRIRWTAESAVYYEAQWTTNRLNDTNIAWAGWGGYVLGPANEQTDSNAVERLKAYRVVAPFAPPPGP